METLFEILKYILPALLVVITASLIIRSLVQRELNLKKLELRNGLGKDIIPIRLQAFERMSLFLERIQFNNLIPRVREPGMSTGDLHRTLIESIRQEWEHNLSQQIYITDATWNQLQMAKDATMQLVNTLAAVIPKETPAEQLIKAIFDFVLQSEAELPAQKALSILKTEVREIF